MLIYLSGLILIITHQFCDKQKENEKAPKKDLLLATKTIRRRKDQNQTTKKNPQRTKRNGGVHQKTKKEMRRVKVKKEHGFLIVTDKETDEQLLVTESWFWFILVSLLNNWKLK